MKFKNKVLLCFTLSGVMLFSGRITSDAQNMAMSLSLKDAQEYALQHNQTVANASIDIQKAEAQKWKAIASMLPQVNASADVTDMFGYQLDLGAQKIAMPAYVSYGVTSSVALSGGQIVSVGLQKLSLKMSDINFRMSRQEIANQTKLLYCSALVGQESLDLLGETLESLQSLYQMTVTSVKTGVAEQTDADQLLVQITTIEDNIASAKRSVEVVYNSLRLLLNIEPGTPIALTDDLGFILNLAHVDAVLAEDFNVESNYTYQLAKASTDLAKKQVSLAGWSSGPTLSVAHQFTKKQYFSNERTMNMTPPNLLSISLRVPIFTSLSTTKGIKDARLAYQKQLNTLQQTEYSLKIQHDQLVYNLRSALEKYNTQTKNVEVSRRVFDNIAAKYKYGVASSMDVTNANNSLVTAKSSYIQSILDIMEAQISLEELLNRNNQ